MAYELNQHTKHGERINERLYNKRFINDFYIDDTTAAKYHYTSLAGLKGILESRTFFFTDSQFLNDYREKVNINQELDRFWSLNKNEYDLRFYKLLSGIRIKDHEDTGYSYFSEDGNIIRCRYYVFSLSTNGDSLSMWKYYSKGNDYQGYCLSIFDYALGDEWIDLQEENEVVIIAGCVKYELDEKQTIIYETVNHLYNIWQKYEISDRLEKKIIQEFETWLSIKAIFFKDNCFKDENETRYVAIVPIEQLSSLKYEYKGNSHTMYDFRIVNDMLVPYIKIPFHYWNADFCYVINAIRVGPSHTFLQKKKSLEMFIESLDYKLNCCPIIESEIPVRY